MNELIDKLREIINLAQAQLDEYVRKNSELVAKLSKIESVQDDVDRQAMDVSKRELAVKHIEDIIAYKAQVEADAEDNRKLKAELTAQVFNNNELYRTRLEEVAEIKARADGKEEKLNEERKAFDEERKNWKSKIISDVSDSMKEKK